MTWSTVPSVSDASQGISSLSNGYVLVGYVIDGYIDSTAIWTAVTAPSTTWTAA